MVDDSRLDLKYFIDQDVYNCPFCKRRHVTYAFEHGAMSFNWTAKKLCYVYFVQCNSCKGRSMHLSFSDITYKGLGYWPNGFKKGIDIDAAIFYSVPSSSFVLDERIPSLLRDLI